MVKEQLKHVILAILQAGPEFAKMDNTIDICAGPASVLY